MIPSSSAGRPALLAWAGILLGTVLASRLFTLAGLPSPELFGALFAGLLYAVVGRGPSVQLPRWGSTLGQALVGASMGALLDTTTLRALGANGLPILAVNLATMALSLLLGHFFALAGRLSPATGTFSLVAGGASGITAIAAELGADDRITSVVQYLRVVLILVGMPLVTALVFHPATATLPLRADAASLPRDLLFVAACCVLGIALARVVHFPSGNLLAPLLVAAVISSTGVLGHVSAPAPLVALGYALVGLQVGLKFTRRSLRQVGRLLPMAVAFIALIIAACAGFGVLLSRLTHMPDLDGYLATTPGGLYAVLATAASSGADVTFVLSVQVIRLVMVLASAPLIARWLRPHPADGEAVDLG